MRRTAAQEEGWGDIWVCKYLRTHVNLRAGSVRFWGGGGGRGVVAAVTKVGRRDERMKCRRMEDLIVKWRVCVGLLRGE